jgi:hypothetical protein
MAMMGKGEFGLLQEEVSLGMQLSARKDSYEKMIVITNK